MGEGSIEDRLRTLAPPGASVTPADGGAAAQSEGAYGPGATPPEAAHPRPAAPAATAADGLKTQGAVGRDQGDPLDNSLWGGIEPGAEAKSLVGRIIHGIRIDALIGRGGMGSVYRGLQVDIDRCVAVKILAPEFSRDAHLVERFLLEAKSLGRCRDPRIIQIHTTFREEGLLGYSMDFADGGSLKGLILKQAPMAEDLVRRLGREAALGLEAAHAEGLVHRDIKPENVLLDRQGSLRIADFGLAKVLETSAELTRSGVIMGTPAYMSPEQAQDSTRVDHRSDLYALGVVLYEMLTGQRPFPGPSAANYMIQHIQNPPAPVRALQPAVSEDLAAIVARLLEKNPDKRFQSGRELAEALGNPRSIKALSRPTEPPDTAPPVSTSSPRDRRLLAILLGAVALGIPLFLYLADRGFPNLFEVFRDRPKPQRNVPVPPEPATTTQSQTPWWIPTRAQQQAAQDGGVPLAITTASGIEMALIPPGRFARGSESVTIATAFYMGRTEMVASRANLTPQRNVSWLEAVDACNALSRAEKRVPYYLPDRRPNPGASGYRLPTEDQWEWACRSAIAGRSLDSVAWYGRPEWSFDMKVGQKLPNAFGLYDMQGLLAEWVDGTVKTGAVNGLSWRVIKGGSWADAAEDCAPEARHEIDAKAKSGQIGFRVCLPVSAGKGLP